MYVREKGDSIIFKIWVKLFPRERDRQVASWSNQELTLTLCTIIAIDIIGLAPLTYTIQKRPSSAERQSRELTVIPYDRIVMDAT